VGGNVLFNGNKATDKVVAAIMDVVVMVAVVAVPVVKNTVLMVEVAVTAIEDAIVMVAVTVVVLEDTVLMVEVAAIEDAVVVAGGSDGIEGGGHSLSA